MADQDTHGRAANGVPPNRWQRTPTVREALPFTPFSSIVPFNPGIIPAPLVTPSHGPGIGLGNHQQVRQVLQELSAGATSAEHASERCQKTLRDVQQLLRPEHLIKYTFKTPRNLAEPAKPSTKRASEYQPPKLSAFAQMALDQTVIPIRYLTPESPKSKPKPLANGHAMKVEVQSKLPTPSSDVKLPNGQRTPQAAQPVQQTAGAQRTDYDKTTPYSSQQGKVLLRPDELTPAERAQYQYVDDNSVSIRPVVSSGQRQQSDVAVKSLQCLLDDLFEAEEHLHSGGMEGDVDGLLYMVDLEDGPTVVLQPATRERLDAAILAVVKVSRSDEIPVDTLIRTQKLCHSSLSSAVNLGLQIDEAWSTDDTRDWTNRITEAASALLAARTLLRIMTAGREEQQLQSEELVGAILKLLNNAIEVGLVPVIEERSFIGEKVRGGDKPRPNPKFEIATQNRDALRVLLNSVTKTLRLLGTLLSKVDIDESALSSTVFTAKALIFAENATNDKDSVFGIQSVESMRKSAMDILGRIFTKYTDQRQFVIDEVLLSLEKLPATKQSARQFRIPDMKPIQLVSALLMRLVQTSATSTSTALHLHSRTGDEEDDHEGSDESEDEDAEAASDDDEIRVSPSKPRKASDDLVTLVKPLYDAATADASHIIRILTNRALTTSKNSDEPYRKLLDIFTEDFLQVLGSSDWPAAELLLRMLLLQMMQIAQNPKNAQASRNLALELLGIMGSGTLQLQIQARNAAHSLVTDASTVTTNLINTFERMESGDFDNGTLLAFDGPYRVVLEYIHARDGGSDAQLQTARGLHLVQWAHALCGGREGSMESERSDGSGRSKDLQGKLRSMIMSAQWLESNYDFPSVPTAAGRLAAILVTLNTTFCKAFNHVLSTLLNALADEHPTVKSRALKSVITILEKDPSVLDRNKTIMQHIFRCAEDKSALVRDSALRLISKCTSLRPALDATVCPQIILRSEDPQVGVRKTATKMLKDIYLRNEGIDLRSIVANACISRLRDSEESIAELARAVMEEIWFAPHYAAQAQHEGGVQTKLRFQSQAALLVRTVDLGEDVSNILVSLFRDLLARSKSSADNAKVCKTLIEVLSDGIIDPSDIPGSPSQDAILETLAVFARSCPTFITASHLERLEPYTQNLATDDDLAVYRSVLTILRFTMPYVHTLRSDFLQKLQTSLMLSMSRLPKPEIAEVASCLWTIDGQLKNTEKLVNLVISALEKVRGLIGQPLGNDIKTFNRICKLMNIVGQFGRACDLEAHLGTFREKLALPKAKSVSELAIGILCAFTGTGQVLAVREAALDAICATCLRWPKQYLRPEVTRAFDLVQKERLPSLEHIFLSGLEAFFAAQELPADRQEGRDGAPTGREGLESTYVATDQDGASSALAQRFLRDILRQALASCDDLALTATKLIASILQQGLPHPKECGPSLVALETSPNPAIAKLAFVEHRVMHQKHETTIEKEYMRAVQHAFAYQQSVVGSVTGYIGQPTASKLKLFWDVLKEGKLKVRQKFLNNICQKFDFEAADVRIQDARSSHLDFVRFCCGNLAFFEYDRTDDLLLLLAALDKTFATNGTTVAQAIEQNVLLLNLDALTDGDAVSHGLANGAVNGSTSADGAQLQVYATSSQVLLVVQETRSYLQRVWNLQRMAKKAKGATKENSKAPARSSNALAMSESYLSRIEQIVAMPTTSDAQRAVCKQFVDVMTTDHDVKVPEEDELVGEFDDATTNSETASRRSPSVTPTANSRGKKRKSTGSAGTTPRKKARPSLAKSKSGSKALDEDEDGEWA
ncbi:Sister chromatid cohesion protein 2 [Oleoguttula sp. CCFEE 5521]